MLPLALYRCETWSFALREHHILRVFNTALWKTFGPKSDEVTAQCVIRSYIICALHEILLA